MHLLHKPSVQKCNRAVPSQDIMGKAKG